MSLSIMRTDSGECEQTLAFKFVDQAPGGKCLELSRVRTPIPLMANVLRDPVAAPIRMRANARP
ncbi:MAG: hypothetical protein R8J85_06790 [Mariprofundales bacterium]